jgi:hypothetical protein
LKLERKTLDRAVAVGAIRYTIFAALPTRWSHARRAREASQSAERAYRDATARIGEIHKQLATE